MRVTLIWKSWFASFVPAECFALKAVIRVEDDYALKSSDVPEAVAKNFVVRQLVVSLTD